MSENYNDCKEIFAERFAELRQQYGTQKEFEKDFNEQMQGKNMSITTATISNYENGKRSPELDYFTAIADFLGVSYDYLLGKSDAKKRENIDIEEATGLNDKSIEVIHSFTKTKLNKRFHTETDPVTLTEIENHISYINKKVINYFINSSVFHTIIRQIEKTFKQKYYSSLLKEYIDTANIDDPKYPEETLDAYEDAYFSSVLEEQKISDIASKSLQDFLSNCTINNIGIEHTRSLDDWARDEITNETNKLLSLISVYNDAKPDSIMDSWIIDCINELNEKTNDLKDIFSEIEKSLSEIEEESKEV